MPSITDSVQLYRRIALAASPWRRLGLRPSPGAAAAERNADGIVWDNVPSKSRPVAAIAKTMARHSRGYSSEGSRICNKNYRAVAEAERCRCRRRRSTSLAEELHVEYEVRLVWSVGIAVDVFESLKLARTHVTC